eukprot:TRINITY_DN27290_c0_g1_i1.p1 TRINITY_DN27290_c0_g1~~TRINITY_DN27290_c0_g1_i1.p1  ORF type:complete len:230 (+),score=25.18 TRINITY_DN27290_c0_g1_i1:57-746(+)
MVTEFLLVMFALIAVCRSNESIESFLSLSGVVPWRQIGTGNCSLLPTTACTPANGTSYYIGSGFTWYVSTSYDYRVNCSCIAEADWTVLAPMLPGSKLSYSFEAWWKSKGPVTCEATWPSTPVSAVNVQVQGYGDTTSEYVEPVLDSCAINFDAGTVAPGQTFSQTINFHSTHTTLHPLMIMIITIPTVIGGVCCIVIIVIVVVCYRRHKRRRAQGNDGAYTVVADPRR